MQSEVGSLSQTALISRGLKVKKREVDEVRVGRLVSIVGNCVYTIIRDEDLHLNLFERVSSKAFSA